MTVTVEENCFELGEDDIFLINPITFMRHAAKTAAWSLCRYACQNFIWTGRYRRIFSLIAAVPASLVIPGDIFIWSILSPCCWKIILRAIHLLIVQLYLRSPADRRALHKLPKYGSVQEPHSVKYLNRIRSIQNYIHENYMKNITLTEIAAENFWPLLICRPFLNGPWECLCLSI